MARNKAFNVHDLYPADYCFGYQAFCNNPEAYVFTLEDIAYINAMELERYEREAPMAYYEKTLLRKWVMSGHSPREKPPSRYLCLTGSEPYDFLDIHRMDKEIRRDMKGMSKAEQKSFYIFPIRYFFKRQGRYVRNTGINRTSTKSGPPWVSACKA